MKLVMLMAIALTSGTDASSLAPIITAMATLVEIMGAVWSVMVSNPLLVVFLAASLLCVGIKLFRKIKGAAKG